MPPRSTPSELLANAHSWADKSNEHLLDSTEGGAAERNEELQRAQAAALVALAAVLVAWLKSDDHPGRH